MLFVPFRPAGGRRPVPGLAGPARAIARQQARQLMLVRKHTQPAAVYIARLTATATFAYLLALVVPAGTSRPVLAPLTALLVLQASLYQTIRSGIRKVVSVIAGVLIAVALSALVGFSWWLLALLIAGSLLLGYLLRLGDDILEVPISAMLIFATAGGQNAAASGRIIDTLVGTAAGLAGGLAFAPLRVQSAREAVGELAGRLAGLLDRMAADLTGTPDGETPDPARAADWLAQTRTLRGEIERVDDTLRQAEESARMNPRTLRVPDALPITEVALRGGLESLEHAALTLRGLARSVLDSSRLDNDASPVRDEQTRERLANVLEPRTGPEGGSTEWPLRGEILVHVDRLRTGLNVDAEELNHQRRRVRRPARRTRAGQPGGTPRRRHPFLIGQPRIGKARRPRDITPTR